MASQTRTRGLLLLGPPLLCPAAPASRVASRPPGMVVRGRWGAVEERGIRWPVGTRPRGARGPREEGAVLFACDAPTGGHALVETEEESGGFGAVHGRGGVGCGHPRTGAGRVGGRRQKVPYGRWERARDGGMCLGQDSGVWTRPGGGYGAERAEPEHLTLAAGCSSVAKQRPPMMP